MFSSYYLDMYIDWYMARIVDMRNIHVVMILKPF